MSNLDEPLYLVDMDSRSNEIVDSDRVHDVRPRWRNSHTLIGFDIMPDSSQWPNTKTSIACISSIDLLSLWRREREKRLAAEAKLAEIAPE